MLKIYFSKYIPYFQETYFCEFEWLQRRLRNHSVPNTTEYHHKAMFKCKITWWRHQMETFSALLAICAGIHRSPVNSPHKGQWRGALMFSLICVWINGWINNREAGDLRRYRAHYDVIVMYTSGVPRCITIYNNASGYSRYEPSGRRYHGSKYAPNHQQPPQSLKQPLITVSSSRVQEVTTKIEI